MKCYHYATTAVVPSAWAPRTWAQIDLPNGAYLAVHDKMPCPEPSTALGHLLLMQTVPPTVARALARYGVSASDTVATAMVKVGAVSAPFRP